MSAPEMPLVLRIDARTAPARPAALLERQLNNAHMQIDALLDAITAQALFVWLGIQDGSPSNARIDAKRRAIRAEWVRIALAATNHKGPNR